MAIKLIMNYPQTDEGIRLIEERQAAVVANSLRRMLSKAQLNELIGKLKSKLTKTHK